MELVFVSEQFADDLNTVEPTPDGQRGLLPSYSIWNATVNLPVRALHSTLFVTAKNLLDSLAIADRTRGILPTPPRSVQAGIVARF